MKTREKRDTPRRARTSRKLISEMQMCGTRLKHLRGAGTNRAKALLRRMGL